MKLNELGEREIIRRIFRTADIKQKVDDCAILPHGNSYFLYTTDVIRQTTHIPIGATAELIGKFAVNINLSDIAAMGGVPDGFMFALLAPPDAEIEFIEELVSSMSRSLHSFDCELLGGDTKEGSELVIAGVAIGHQLKAKTMTRSRLKKGQIVAHLNRLGRGGAGYLSYVLGINRDQGIKMMLDVKARIREAQIIAEHGGKFMMDLSDGLFASMSQMKSDFGVGFKIVEDEIKMDQKVKAISKASGMEPLDIIDYGGDYELLFSIDNSNYRDFISAMEAEKIDVHFIGEAWEGDNIMFDGERWIKLKRRGWEHFSKPPGL
ncbi:MAG TPA: thiamine-phosphate kinase [Thermoplasmataceae archaeon]|nr:thiamine-phosphate kinase [Thermoplasmataceae archaeon]